MNHSLRLSFAIKVTKQKVFRRLQHHKIQNTHNGAGIIFSWSVCGLQGEALCCSMPKISNQSANFTQQRDIKAWQASEGHWSQTWPHHHPGGICPGRTAFHSYHLPSAIINLLRTGAAWRFYGAFTSSRPVCKVRGRNGEWSSRGQGNTPALTLVKTPSAVGTRWEWRRFSVSNMTFAWKPSFCINLWLIQEVINKYPMPTSIPHTSL